MNATGDARALAPLYGLLSLLFRREIDRDLLAALRQREIIEVLDRITPGVAADLERDWSDCDFEQAAVEFCALFVTPNGASPRARAWLPEGPEAAVQRIDAPVARILAALDVEPADEIRTLPRDHISFLLQLVAYVLEEDAEDALPLAGALIEQTLLPWVPRFADALSEKATNPVYQALSRLLPGLLGAN